MSTVDNIDRSLIDVDKARKTPRIAACFATWFVIRVDVASCSAGSLEVFETLRWAFHFSSDIKSLTSKFQGAISVAVSDARFFRESANLQEWVSSRHRVLVVFETLLNFWITFYLATKWKWRHRNRFPPVCPTLRT